MVLDGVVISSPSDGVERPVANHIAVRHGALPAGQLVGVICDGDIFDCDPMTDRIQDATVTLDDGRVFMSLANGFYDFPDVTPRYACVDVTKTGYYPAHKCAQVEPGMQTYNSVGLIREGTIVDAGPQPDGAPPGADGPGIDPPDSCCDGGGGGGSSALLAVVVAALAFRRRVALAVAAVVVSVSVARAEPAHENADEPAHPTVVGASATHEFGVFMASNTKLGVTLAHAVGGRFHVGIGLGAGTGNTRAAFGASRLFVHEELVEAGIVLHPSRTIDLVLGWRVGHAAFWFSGMTVNTMTMSPLLRIDYAYKPRWTIQVEPIILRGYWSSGWGTNLGVQVALGYGL
jgi:hypothetical protein